MIEGQTGIRTVFRNIFGALFVLSLFLLTLPLSADAAWNMHEYKDTLSNSAPNEYSNHTIRFTPTIAIPPGGYITITPETGAFTIPAATFDYENVEVYVNNVKRAASTTPTATTDGINITSGTSGQVTVTLNATNGISAEDEVRILLGDHTAFATSSDTGFLNPSATGTHSVGIAIGGGAEAGSVEALVAIVESVGVGPIDTTETDPPERFNGAPTGTLAGTVSAAEISLETNELAECRYSTASGTPYFSMTRQFDETGFISHLEEVTGLATSTEYRYFIRCIDDEGNFNTDDFEISFIIEPAPQGEPGSGDSDGDGSGSGDGTGDTGSGSGSSGGDSGGGGSGGGGGGGGGGGPEDDDAEFPSGDADVVISGFAFPQSEIHVMVDGALYDDTVNANSSGSFSITVEAVSRGTHTFGIYAVDGNNVRSSTFNTTFSVIGARGSSLSGISLAPSIRVTPDPVPNPGDTVTFSGYSIPDSTITVEAQSTGLGAQPRTYTTTSDGGGRWTVSQSTAGYARGSWQVRARSEALDGSPDTDFSKYTPFSIGQSTNASGGDSDLNQDGNVNITDFSILLFWWGSDGGDSDPSADINQNGSVALEDFSIMLFNWTG